MMLLPLFYVLLQLETNAPPAWSEEGPGNREQTPKGESRRKVIQSTVAVAVLGWTTAGDTSNS